MRILVLSKRQYTNRDLIDDRFGRLRELPLALAGLGHAVTGICLSYRSRNEGRFDDHEKAAQVSWHLLNLWRLFSLRAGSYWNTADKIGREFRPDLVWACSDAIHAILGVHVARKLNVPLIVDLYDNFESFPLTRIPGITRLFRRALGRADGVTCVSQPLAGYLRDSSACSCPVNVIENAVPEGLFYQRDQLSCRRELNLPQNGILIGTAGAISRSRGIETLFAAFEILARKRPDVHLVLAGAVDKGLALPKNPKSHYLGLLHANHVPVLLSALNISVICNIESDFGKYCFPQKFYESVACGVPIVAAAAGSMREMLKDHSDQLYTPGNTAHLADALLRQIEKPSVLPMNVPTWNMLGKKLEICLLACLQANRNLR